MIGLLLLVLLVPIKVAGNYLGADRTGFGWCFLAIIVGLAFMKAGENYIQYGEIWSIFLSAAGFSIVMGTTYLKGLAIALFHLIVVMGVGFVLLALFGEEVI